MTVDAKPGSYNAVVDRLAAKALALAKQKPSDSRVLIGISGIPGSGKTTLAQAVVSRVNAVDAKLRGQPASPPAMVVPMDGFHLYRSELAAMPDPATAIHRRGAAFTFAADRFHQLVKELAKPMAEPGSSSSQTVYAPSFDHAKKDPVEDDIAIAPGARVVVIEGLYLSLDREPWASAARLLDEVWFVEADKGVARSRLIGRHVESGIVKDREAAEHRVDSTDLLNADDILGNRLAVDEVVELPEM